jgi:CBS domain-containing protein
MESRENHDCEHHIAAHEPAAALWKMKGECGMPVGECCSIGVVCCEADASIPEVARLMRKHHVGDVVVVEFKDDARYPIGILTDRDIVIETIALELDVNLFTASDFMSAPLVTVDEDADFIDTLRLMRTHKIRRIPVITGSGSLYGIVSIDDIINLLTMELSLMTGAIVEQPIKEGKLRK